MDWDVEVEAKRLLADADHQYRKAQHMRELAVNGTAKLRDRRLHRARELEKRAEELKTKQSK